MTDIVDKNKRSEMMSGIQGKNTAPEILVRSGLHRLGFRFRIHYSKLPGKPDIALPKYNAVILIHGCFWHGHNCHLFKWPQTNPEFWRKKIQSNCHRDLQHRERYGELGWKTLIIWECAMKGKYKHPLPSLIKAISRWIKEGQDGKNMQGIDLNK